MTREEQIAAICALYMKAKIENTEARRLERLEGMAAGLWNREQARAYLKEAQIIQGQIDAEDNPDEIFF